MRKHKCVPLILTIVSRPLASITQKIHHKLPSKLLDGENVFPAIPGCHLEPSSPALEFVKAVCQVSFISRLLLNRLA